MTASQTDKAIRFRDLHAAQETFLIANVWDGGSARILAGLGFKALATSSGASAATLGRLDGHVSREEALAQVRVLVGATDLPISADLEKGFGDSPEIVAETIRLAGAAGLVGGSNSAVAAVNWRDKGPFLVWNAVMRTARNTIVCGGSKRCCRWVSLEVLPCRSL